MGVRQGAAAAHVVRAHAQAGEAREHLCPVEERVVRRIRSGLESRAHASGPRAARAARRLPRGGAAVGSSRPLPPPVLFWPCVRSESQQQDLWQMFISNFEQMHIDDLPGANDYREEIKGVLWKHFEPIAYMFHVYASKGNTGAGGNAASGQGLFTMSLQACTSPLHPLHLSAASSAPNCTAASLYTAELQERNPLMHPRAK